MAITRDKKQRIRTTECPLCACPRGDGWKEFAYHLANHGPEDAGLSPLWSSREGE